MRLTGSPNGEHRTPGVRVGLGGGATVRVRVRVTVDGAGAGTVTVRVPVGRATGLLEAVAALVCGAGAALPDRLADEDRLAPVGPPVGGIDDGRVRPLGLVFDPCELGTVNDRGQVPS